MSCKTQTVPFFGLAPEVRNAIYAAVVDTIDDYALFSRTGFGAGKLRLNDMVIPGLLFTCRQALQEGMGIFRNCKTHYHLDILNTHLPTVITRPEDSIVEAENDAAAEAGTAIYRLLRPSTDALLRIAPTAIQINSLSLRVCLQNDRIWGISDSEDGKCHKLVFFHVTFDVAGAIRVSFREHHEDVLLQPAAPLFQQSLEDLRRRLMRVMEEHMILDETTHALSDALQKGLEERLKRRSNKWLEYHDLELVLEICNRNSKCWCVSKCVL